MGVWLYFLLQKHKSYLHVLYFLFLQKKERNYNTNPLCDIEWYFSRCLRVCFCFSDDIGLFPNILNLATRSTISVNATCGEEKSEVFCKLVDHVKIFPYKNSHCDICDARSRDERQRHPITNAINGRNSWWQSPTLTNGAKFNYVTITLDLKQV